MSHEIMQVFVEDHVSPFMNAIGGMRLKAGRVMDLPPLPAEAVEVVQGIGVGGPYIKMLPTAALMAWAADVRARAEAGIVCGPLRREAVVSRNGSAGYTEVSVSLLEAGQRDVTGCLRSAGDAESGAG